MKTTLALFVLLFGLLAMASVGFLAHLIGWSWLDKKCEQWFLHTRDQTGI